MPKYVFTYRRPQNGETAGSMEDWMQWFDGIRDNVIEIGQPTGDTRRLGNDGGGSTVSGYSIVSAGSLDAAAELASGCPALKAGGGLEIGELLEIHATA